MNQVTLMGRLTADVTIRETTTGTKVANYRLAVDRRFKKDGQQTADFFPCTVFGKSAEFAANYFKKGMRVAVNGRLQNDNYTDKDGRPVTRTIVVVENQEFADSRGASAPGDAPAQAPAAKPAEPAGGSFMNLPEEDLPFN